MNKTITAAMALLGATAIVAPAAAEMARVAQLGGAGHISADDLLEAGVYARQGDTMPMASIASAGLNDYDKVGEVEDLIMDSDGSIEAVIVDVGGFLGLGAHEVALDYATVLIVPNTDDARTIYVILNATKDTLEAMPTFDEARMGMAGTPEVQGKVSTSAAGEMGAPIVVVGVERAAMRTPMVEREGYATAMVGDLTTDQIVGASVYGSGDGDIGEVDELVLGKDERTVEAYVLDIGGFLGIGEHRVAVSPQEVQVMHNGRDVRVYVDASKSELEALPKYEG